MKRHFLLTLLACLLGVQVFALDYSSENSCYNNHYVNEWGKLKLVGNQLSSESGQPVQLRGWSTHGKQWHGSCFDGKEDFEGMKKLGANIARIAMYINEGGWVDLNWIKDCVKWTNELGMYCLVDWHILTPGNPNDGSYSGAENFFRELSQWVAQSGYKNVVYEICNEPNEDTEGDIYRPKVWGQIKEYCEKILPVISNNDPGAVVLVGTPQWDKALVFPMEDPINTYGLNVMYTFHHYTCDQQQFLGILSSAAAFVPVFVSEWGLTKDDGGADGMVCEDGGDRLMAVCNGVNLGNQKISWCNWSWSPDGRSSSALNSCGNYSEGNLRQSGRYIVKQLRKGDDFKSSSSSSYEGAQLIKETEDSYIALDKYDKGGQDLAFFEYDDPSWLFDINSTCNAGGEARKDECVDLGKTGKEDPFYYNLGYVVAGEWVKYTVMVEKAGVYEFETYTNNHIDNNVFGICVDGENAIVDENGDDTYRALKLRTSGNGDANDGYGDWGWTTPYSQHKDGKFFIRFKTAGEHVLGISFMSSCSGLGSLKFKALNTTSVMDAASEDVEVNVWPNPSENGNFNVALNCDANVSILNSQGVCVFDKYLKKGTNMIDISAPEGVYVLSVKSDNNNVIKKLIVK